MTVKFYLNNLLLLDGQQYQWTDLHFCYNNFTAINSYVIQILIYKKMNFYLNL